MPRIVRNLTGLLMAFALGFVVLASGCSSHASVSGKVTYQGRTLNGGTVLFASTQGKGSETATIGEDGTYSFARIPTGPVKISVETKTAQPATGKNAPPPNMQPPKGVPLPSGAQSGVYGQSQKKVKVELIPEHFGDPEKSGATYTVVSGSQTHNIDLK
jgi:hypothetical protein